MRDFYEINEWADAVSRLSEEADTRKLAALAESSQVEALKILKEQKLIKALQDMTDCIRNVEVNQVADKVAAALKIVTEKRNVCQNTGIARLLLDLVWEKYKGLAFEHPLSGYYDRAYFESQTKIIETLLEHRLFMQAFTAIRECIGSIGMVGLPTKYQHKMTSSNGKSERCRFAEVFCSMVQYPEMKWEFTERRYQYMLILKPWWEYLKSIGCIDLLKSIGEQDGGKLFDYRNGFDHAWTRVSTLKTEKLELAGKTYLAKLREILNILDHQDAFSWRPPT